MNNCCGVCGAKLPVNARFCGKCGNAVTVYAGSGMDSDSRIPPGGVGVSRYCRKCGTSLPMNARFCGKCGSSVVTYTEVDDEASARTLSRKTYQMEEARGAMSGISRGTVDEATGAGPVERKFRRAAAIGFIVGIVIGVIVFLVAYFGSGDVAPVAPQGAENTLKSWFEVIFGIIYIFFIIFPLYGVGLAFGWNDVKRWTLKGTVVAGNISFYLWIKTLFFGDGERNFAKALTYCTIAITFGFTIGTIIGMFKGIKALIVEKKARKRGVVFQ